MNNKLLCVLAGLLTLTGAQAMATNVTTVSGDGTLISNVNSPGAAVTLTLGNAPAYTLWGNNTSSSAAPGYQTSPEVSGTLTVGGGSIIVTSASSNSTFVSLNDTISGGHDWALFSSGGGPETVGYFGIYDDSAGARLTIDTSGNLDVLAGNVNIGDSGGAYQIDGSTVLALPDGDTTSIAVGESALASQSSVTSQNVAVGNTAGQHITSGEENIAVGYLAMRGVSATPMTGQQNVAVGTGAAEYISTGDYNVGVGQAALQGSSSALLTGDANTGIGAGAIETISGAADDNTAVGFQAGESITTGTDNTLVGYDAGSEVTGSHNIVLGESTSITTGNSNIIIGNTSTEISGTVSSQFDIGDTIYGTLGSGGATTIANATTINGNFTVNGSSTTTTIDGNLNVGSDTSSTDIQGDLYISGNNLVSGPSYFPLCWSYSNGQVAINTNADDCTYTSEDLERDITPLTNALAEVEQFEPVQFRYKSGSRQGDDKKVHVDFSAHHMAKIDPRIVYFDDKGKPVSVAYKNITAINSAAIQELHKEMQRQIDELKAELNTLREQQGK